MDELPGDHKPETEAGVPAEQYELRSSDGASATVPSTSRAPEIEAAPKARGNQSLMEVAGIEEIPLAEPTVPSVAPQSHPADVSPASPATAGVELRDAAEAALAAGPKRARKGTSRLGLLAMLLGIAACLLCRETLFPPTFQISPVPPAVIGLTLALLAMAGIMVGSKAKAGVPVLAMLLCLVALSVSAYQSGVRDVQSSRIWAEGQYYMYKSQVVSKYNSLTNPTSPPAQPAGPFAGQTTPTAPLAGQTPSGNGAIASPGIGNKSGAAGPGASPQGTAADPDAGIGAGTIFDMRTGTRPASGTAGPTPAEAGNGTANTALPASPGSVATPSPIVPAIPAPGGLRTAPLTPRVMSAQASLQSAQAKVKGVEDNFRFAFEKANNPEYLAAKMEVDAADKLVEDAKRRSDGYGQPLIEATRVRKEAQEKVARIENEAMSRDVAVTAARSELTAAEKSLRDAYDAAVTGR